MVSAAVPQIREVTMADAPLLATLHREAFGAAAWPQTMVAESLAQEATAGLALIEGERFCGFLLYQHIATDFEILTFAVAPACQRRGYGRFLLQEFYDRAKTTHIETLFLEVAEDNLPALRLYTGFGFVVAGKRPRYYPRPSGAVAAILMRYVIV